ncbi:MAG: glutamate--tRNA ligase [Verrucomicrobia bacterium]|nr:glutamate--tRNA ligase [Verrucomicrobiota bacterium]
MENIAQSAVRTRVAPSPTGDPHVGTAYMALFNLVFARKHGGQFILRIEDTDRARSTEKSEKAILDSLGWLGLQWDEGPDVGGDLGPYRQSERLDIYEVHVQKLLENGSAYRCFCSSERLSALRSEQMANKETPRYDGHCLSLDLEEAESHASGGTPYVVRLNVPTEGECIFRDELRDEIRIAWSQVDHQVLRKSDGFPTYHLANVVDDHLMEITHVIRGEEWINSAPKHILLYEAFGWAPPTFIHLPLLRNPDKSKLSKRKNPTSIFHYRDAGFLPEAVANYLGMMAYTLPDQREIFSISDMSETFDSSRISLGGPIFDVTKLKWLNGRYLREKLSANDLLARLSEWKYNDEFLGKVLPLALPRLETFSDFAPLASFLFAEKVEIDAESISGKLESADAARLIKIAEWEFEKLREWKGEAIGNVFNRIAEIEELKLKQLMPTFFVAISGSSVSLPLFDAMAILGPDLSRSRLRQALDVLSEAGHGLSKKGLKALEKEYQAKYGIRVD